MCKGISWGFRSCLRVLKHIGSGHLRSSLIGYLLLLPSYQIPEPMSNHRYVQCVFCGRDGTLAFDVDYDGAAAAGNSGGAQRPGAALLRAKAGMLQQVATGRRQLNLEGSITRHARGGGGGLCRLTGELNRWAEGCKLQSETPPRHSLFPLRCINRGLRSDFVVPEVRATSHNVECNLPLGILDFAFTYRPKGWATLQATMCFADCLTCYLAIEPKLSRGDGPAAVQASSS